MMSRLGILSQEVNAQRERYSDALQAASYRSHQIIVQIVVEKKANVHAPGCEYGNALQAASHGGREKIVQILLEKEADVNA